MKWIILALFACLAVFLFVACKPSDAPDENELKALKLVEHLLKFGFKSLRMEILDAETESLPPIDSYSSDTDNPPLFSPLTQTALGGPPEGFLAANLMEPTPLVAAFPVAIGPTDIFAGDFFILDVECSSCAPVTEARLYFRENKIVVLVEVDEPDNDSPPAIVYKKRLIGRYTGLKPGDYDALLVGANESRQWKLKIRSRSHPR